MLRERGSAIEGRRLAPGLLAVALLLGLAGRLLSGAAGTAAASTPAVPSHGAVLTAPPDGAPTTIFDAPPNAAPDAAAGVRGAGRPSSLLAALQAITPAVLLAVGLIGAGIVRLQTREAAPPSAQWWRRARRLARSATKILHSSRASPPPPAQPGAAPRPATAGSLSPPVVSPSALAATSPAAPQSGYGPQRRPDLDPEVTEAAARFGAPVAALERVAMRSAAARLAVARLEKQAVDELRRAARCLQALPPTVLATVLLTRLRTTDMLAGGAAAVALGSGVVLAAAGGLWLQRLIDPPHLVRRRSRARAETEHREEGVVSRVLESALLAAEGGSDLPTSLRWATQRAGLTPTLDRLLTAPPPAADTATVSTRLAVLHDVTSSGDDPHVMLSRYLRVLRLEQAARARRLLSSAPYRLLAPFALTILPACVLFLLLL